ncbi:hypothetical protein [Flavobacterium sp.]|jgi:TRAP-type C4-dicarboxylate transport system permease small subunit|uniref:hypothetical protein n=1 Tax=Flavobacterium sp. TaxID=239 RepID=UPI0037C11676
MKKVILAFLVFQISILFVGCSAVDDVASGFVIVALIIGGPLMLLLLFGNIVSNIRNKGKYSHIEGSLSENLFGLIVMLIFLFGLFKGCSD